MTRFLAALLLAAVAASFARADVPPPPPPKGKKYVDVTNEVLAGKDLKGYVFVQRATSGFPGSQTFTFGKVELDEKKAAAMPAPTGKFGSVALLAVPEDAAKEFKTDKELFEALEKKKVKGVQEVSFTTKATVDDKIKENAVKWTYTVTVVDAKGIQAKISGEGYEEPKTPDEKKDKPLAFTEPGYWVAGLAAALGVTAGGLWLVRRGRRGV